jgi:hypothetical protein
MKDMCITQPCGAGQAVPSRQSHIAEAMSRLDSATHRTAKLVDDFILRVNDILREEPPAVNGEEKQEEDSTMATPLARAIQVQTDRLIGICATLRCVIDQVEL